jgi:hypothetical protein
MASFAAQLKDKFLGVIYRVTGWSSGGAGVGKDTILPEEPTKFAIVQVYFHVGSYVLVDVHDQDSGPTIVIDNSAVLDYVLLYACSPLRSDPEVASRNPMWITVI